MDWYLCDLNAMYVQRLRELQSRNRPPAPSRRRRAAPLRRRLASSFVWIGMRLDAEASAAALRLSPERA
jgi:hypothetical protein